jgi:hypothetical protein
MAVVRKLRCCKMMNYPYINVEELFDELVRQYGTAVVLRDKFPDGVPFSFPNADYVFHSERVVAELKCLMDDNSGSVGNQSKLNALLNLYFSEGKISTKEITEATWKTFPNDLQIKISKIFSHSIHARVKKTNIQIRETKKNLGMDSYAGVLLVANDGLTGMSPAAFIDATLRDIVENERDSIDLFIYFTVNLFASIEGTPHPSLFWMPMSMHKPPKVSEDFPVQLGKAWQQMVNRKLGITHFFPQQLTDDDMGKFWQARHIKNDSF